MSGATDALQHLIHLGSGIYRTTPCIFGDCFFRSIFDEKAQSQLVVVIHYLFPADVAQMLLQHQGDGRVSEEY